MAATTQVRLLVRTVCIGEMFRSVEELGGPGERVFSIFNAEALFGPEGAFLTPNG